MIRAGYRPELDELRDLSRNGKRYIARIEERERQRTGIGSLKVRFNNVFGYYIEITRANQHLAPADYERKQTLANAERFTTPELKDYERKVLDAEEKILDARKGIVRRSARPRGRPGPAREGRRRRPWRSWTWPPRWRRWPPRTAIPARRFPKTARCASWRAAIR